MSKHVFDGGIRRCLGPSGVGENDPLLMDWVVMPSGVIKTIYYERNVSPALLHIEKRGQADGRVSSIERTSVPAALQALGYAMLVDLYRAEDRMEDWETFQLYQRQCRKHHVKEDISDEYLPEEVLRRRKEWQETDGKVALPPPQRKKQAKKVAQRKASAGRGKLQGGAKGQDGGYEIQRRRVAPWLLMGRKDAAALMALADERDALADGVL